MISEERNYAGNKPCFLFCDFFVPHAVVMGSREQSLADWASSAGGSLALAPHNIHVAQGGKEEVVFFTKPFVCLCFEHA